MTIPDRITIRLESSGLKGRSIAHTTYTDQFPPIFKNWFSETVRGQLTDDIETTNRVLSITNKIYNQLPDTLQRIDITVYEGDNYRILQLYIAKGREAGTLLERLRHIDYHHSAEIIYRELKQYQQKNLKITLLQGEI